MTRRTPAGTSSSPTWRSVRGTSGNYWLFTGEQRDSDSSFYSLRARYYDPSLGRFLARDPVAGSSRRPSTQNRYSYVENNPLNRFDPYGLCCSISDITDTVSDAKDTLGSAVDWAEKPVSEADSFLRSHPLLLVAVQAASGRIAQMTCTTALTNTVSAVGCGISGLVYVGSTYLSYRYASSDTERYAVVAGGALVVFPDWLTLLPNVAINIFGQPVSSAYAADSGGAYSPGSGSKEGAFQFSRAMVLR